MKNLHRTFAFLRKERYTCHGKKNSRNDMKKNSILKNSFWWERFDKIYK